MKPLTIIDLRGRGYKRGRVRVLYFSTEKDDDVAFGSRDASVGNRDVIVYGLPDQSLMINCQLLIRSIQPIFSDSSNVLCCSISQSSHGMKTKEEEKTSKCEP